MSTVSPPTSLRFEHHAADQPVLGITTASPRVSWQVVSAPTGYVQRGYEIEVTREGRPAAVHEVRSHEQVLVPWPDIPLTPRERAAVRVRVTGDGAEGSEAARAWSEWSEPAIVEAGLLAPADWTARFITARHHGALDAPAPLLRGSVDVPGDVDRARLYITAHGVYIAELNGARVGDHVLAPGWTSYEHRLRYQTFDVTDLARAGGNTLEVLLGNGWYRGRLGFTGGRAQYGERLGLLAQLEITTTDGTVHVLATDGTWAAADSDVLADDLYDGQRTDLRRTRHDAPAGRGVGSGSRDAAAEPAPAAGPVDVCDEDVSRLVGPDGPPVRVIDTLQAREVLTSPSGATLVDFGQNLVGWVRLRVRGLPAGHEVTIRHAEVLEDGELGVRPLRTAKATDSYVLAGGRDHVCEPSLTFHGFRYAEVSGVPDLRADDIEAVVVGSDLRRTGWFSSSHDLLDRFHDNVVWSARGNFLDVPTDCPQRDERLGWTGDIQVFSPTAHFLFDCGGFLTSWLADLAAEQHGDGAVPFVVPDVLRQPDPAAAAWADAATVVPWVTYQRTGDLELLRRQLPSMRAWVGHMAALAGDDRVWRGGFQFGDWLDPTAPPDAPFAAKADPDVIATAHLAQSARIVALAAAELDEHATAARYDALAGEVRAAFAREFVTPSGRVLSDAQTVYALALVWNLLPTTAQRDHAAGRLADLVRTSGMRISTGFVGTPLIADALTDTGAADLAYRLVLQTRCPSWLYPVTMGATTVWERWDSMLPDGGINPGEMTSFNHYALGAVADWLHRRVAGLAPAAPGYRELEVRPLPGGGLTSASARHLTPYGEAAVAWERTGGRFTLRVRVPVGASAQVRLPGAVDALGVGHGDHEWTVDDPCVSAGADTAPASIRALVDDERLWSAVADAAVAAGCAGDDAEAAARLGPYLDAPVDRLAAALTAEGLAGDLQHLAARLDGLLR
jgi:alpha-L-rhamnosidase